MEFEKVIVDLKYELYRAEINKLAWTSEELRLLCVLGDQKRREIIKQARKLDLAVITDND